MPTVASIDVGSNAIRLLIANVDTNGEYRTIYSERAPVRLGQDVFTKGVISTHSIDRMLETFTDEAVRNKEVLQLLEKVEMKVDPKLQSGSNGSRPATVTMKLKNGQAQMLHEEFPKGSPQLPMTEDELLAKFRACARGVLGDTSSERALAYASKLAVAGGLLGVFEMSIAKMRVFRVPDFLGAALMLGLLATLLLFVSRGL